MRPILKQMLKALGGRQPVPHLDTLNEKGLVLNPKALYAEVRRISPLVETANCEVLLQTLIDTQWRVLHSDSTTAENPLVYLAPWHDQAQFPGSWYNTQVTFASPAGVVPPHLYSKNKGVIRLNQTRTEGLPLWTHEFKNLGYEWFTPQVTHKYEELAKISKGLVQLKPALAAIYGYSAKNAAQNWLRTEVNVDDAPGFSRSDVSENARIYRQRLRILSRKLCYDQNQTDSGSPALVGHQTLVFSTRQIYETIWRTLPYGSSDDDAAIITYGDWRYKHNLPHFMSWPMALAIAPDLAFQSLDCWPAKPLFVEYKDMGADYILEAVQQRRRTISTRVNKIYGTWRFDKCLSPSENSSEMTSIFYTATCVKCGHKHDRINYRSAAKFPCSGCQAYTEVVTAPRPKVKALGKIAWLRFSKGGPTAEHTGFDLILGGPQPDNVVGYVHLAHRGMNLRVTKPGTPNHTTASLQAVFGSMIEVFKGLAKPHNLTIEDLFTNYNEEQRQLAVERAENERLRILQGDDTAYVIDKVVEAPPPTVAPKNFFDLSDLDEPLASTSAGTPALQATQTTQTDSDLLAMFDDPEDDLPSESGQYN